jgi:hypothetical protein
VGNPEEPAPELELRVVSAEPAEGLDEGVLRQLLSDRCIPYDADDKVEDGTLVTNRQLAIRILRPGQGTSDEFAVGFGHISSRGWATDGAKAPEFYSGN